MRRWASNHEVYGLGIVAKNKKPLGSKGGRNQGVRRAPPSGEDKGKGVAYTEKLGMLVGYHNI